MIKNLKPSAADVSFKYICSKCGYSHWLFMKEVSAKNFFIVCDCGCRIKPKRIKKIKIVFNESKKHCNKNSTQKKNNDSKDKIKSDIGNSKINLNIDILNKASNELMKLGFTKEESISLIKDSFQIIGSENCIDLVKKAIDLVGAIDDKSN